MERNATPLTFLLVRATGLLSCICVYVYLSAYDSKQHSENREKEIS